MKKLIAGILPLLLGTMLLGCQPEGPAEQAGEAVDNAAQNVQDAVNPQGPMEKAGEAVDNAAQEAKDAVTPDGPAEKAGEDIDKAANP